MSNELPEKKKRPSGRKVGSTAIHSPFIKAIRASAILKARTEGVPVAELAAQYRISEKSIYRYMQWAKEEGLLQEIKEQILTQLAPKVIKAYDEALDMDVKTATQGEVEATKVKLVAAKDIGFGAGLLSKKSEQTVVKEEHSMAMYIQNRYGPQNEQTADTEGSPRLDPVHDGSIIDAEEIAETVEPGSGEERIPSWRDAILDDCTDGDGDEGE